MNICQFLANHRPLVIGCATIVLILAAVILFIFLRKRHASRKTQTIKHTPLHPTESSPNPPVEYLEPNPQQPAEKPLPSQSQALPQDLPSRQAPVAMPWPVAPEAAGNISKDWAEFVRDRLGELDPASCDNETKWALGVVDFLDELKDADAEASSEERASSASLRVALLSCLSNKGFALEDSDEWNPDKQRAVAVVRKPDATVTTILGKGSTGLSRNGKIIRKQEVKIVTKGN